MGAINRRKFVKGGAALGALAAGGSLARDRRRAARPLKIGYVSPQTGPLAGFAEADSYILAGVKETLKDGLTLGGETYPVEILVRDSQSNPNRAAEVAKDLIVNDKIDLMTVASTPETTNPVSTQCEIEEIPCISTVAPWQPYFIGRQANPGDPKSWKPFDSTFHFFWGLEDVIAAYTNMWGQVQTNKAVGGLFPNDGDGNAWGDKVVGFPPVLDKLGYKLADPGRYQDLNDDFSAQIAAFKQADCQIITGVVIPPDFTTFWNQANQKGFKPKVASVGKALLFPSARRGARQDAATTSRPRSGGRRAHPFKSSLTGVSAAELAKGYEQASGKQWTQQIGFGARAVRSGGRFPETQRRPDRSPAANRRGDRQDRSRRPSSAEWRSAPTRCRPSRARTSPRRRSSAGNGGSAPTENTRSSSSTIRPPRTSRLAERWRRSPEASKRRPRAAAASLPKGRSLLPSLFPVPRRR